VHSIVVAGDLETPNAEKHVTGEAIRMRVAQIQQGVTEWQFNLRFHRFELNNIKTIAGAAFRNGPGSLTAARFAYLHVRTLRKAAGLRTTGAVQTTLL
jgi:hypothetical protein